MNYRVRRQGAELGTFTLEELRRRRAAGEFTGTEYVQGEGRPDWQPLDLVLRHGLAAIPISAPGPQLPKGPNQKVIWGIIAVAIVLVAIGIGMGAYQATKVFRVVRSATRAGIQSGGNSDALTAAKKPVTWTTNTMTADDVNRRAKEFRVRQWIEGYKERGRHDQPWDAEATQLIQAWINGNYGGTDATNRLSARELGEKLAKEPGC
ncbi:MAG: hypothetical protein JWQ04_1863, partial [Pedosphaera sp.]|nr:hypothetical protein [Pedosphaera sp.]